MSTRKVPIVTNEIYHVFNRTIAKEKAFALPQQSRRLLMLINYYRNLNPIKYSYFTTLSTLQQNVYYQTLLQQQKLVEIYAFSIMDDHYHFECKELIYGGIIKFISNIQNSYARYNNIACNRTGSLFQEQFKAKRITSEEEFIHISRYIHLNPVTSNIIEASELDTYNLTSFSSYAGVKRCDFISHEPIMNHFKSFKRYKKFVTDQVDYQKKLKIIKRLLF